MKKLVSVFIALVLVLTMSLPTLADSASWDAYIEYAADAITAQEEPDFLEMALDTLYNESNEADPDGWPFEMFVGRGLFESYAIFLDSIYVEEAASGEASDEASGEVSYEVTNDTFGSYVSYIRKYLTEYSDPKLDEGGREMALGELDTVDVGSDVTAFPFEMYVNEFGAMTFQEFMAEQANAASVEPETEAEFNAYVDYIRDYMESYDGSGTGEGFDEASRQMALAELDNVAFGSSANGFPFVMFVNEFGALSYEEFLA